MHAPGTGSRGRPPASPPGRPLPTEVERIELPPKPASVGAARRVVRGFAARHQLPGDVVDALCLAASELVTNGILHARTAVVLTVELTPAAVRIGVHDRLLAAPAVRHYTPEALTGRGLGVVAALSSTWGVDSGHDGKLVWAEIDVGGPGTADPDRPPHTTGQPADAAPPADQGRTRTVRFPAVPVSVYMAMQEHNDALYRELELLDIEHDNGPATTSPPRLRTLARRLLGPEFRSVRDSHRGAIAEAQARGDETVELQVQASVQAVPFARTYGALLDDADEYCRAGLLLTTPPLPQVTALRQWFVEQFVAQLLHGSPPSPAEL